MNKKKELVGVKLFNPSEKLTEQVKIVLPKNYIRCIDLIADELKIKKRYVVWDAIGNYIRICKEKSI